MKNCPKCGCVYDGAEQFCPKDGTRLSSDSVAPAPPPEKKDPLIGEVIAGRYKVLDIIGEGGMGVVYVAEHVEIEKRVAVKVLRDDFSKRSEVVERFRQEAKAASRIGHAHIVDVTDFGQLEDGGVFFVMEHLKGEGLVDLMRGNTVPLERAVRIVQQIARALHAAHKMGIVHRDLKPENVFLVDRDDAHDFVKVLDFGIAKISDRDSEGERLTKTGMIFGTPEYMSPEQAAGRSLDHRVDIYALGCIMFEMFTGSVPYKGDSFMAVLTQHMFEPVPQIEEVNPNARVPEPIKNVVYRAMAKKSEDRYADMAELERDLERAVYESGVPVELLVRSGNSDEIPLTLREASGRQQTHPDDVDTAFDLLGKTRKTRPKVIALAVAVVAATLAVAGVVTFAPGVFEGAGPAPVSVPASKTVPIAATSALSQNDDAVVESRKGRKEEGSDYESETAFPRRAGEQGKIDVTIETVPEGALIFVENMGQVCSSSPCQVGLSAGTPVDIEARLHGRVSTMTFTPSGQNTKAMLEVEKPDEKKKKKSRKSKERSKRPSEEKKKKPPKEKTKSRSDGEGLKIPTVFTE